MVGSLVELGAGFCRDVVGLDFFPAVDAGGFEQDLKVGVVAELAGGLEGDGLLLAFAVVAGELVLVAHFFGAVGFG